MQWSLGEIEVYGRGFRSIARLSTFAADAMEMGDLFEEMLDGFVSEHPLRYLTEDTMVA